ncbi:aldehyde dehydrogenase family protein [Tomitella cavernea]
MLPRTATDRLLYSGITADLWLRPGVRRDDAERRARPACEPGASPAGVGVVLGAGNVTAIGPMDVLDSLVVHGRPAILKLNPTFSGLLEAYAAALAPLIAADLVAVVNGGAEVGADLVAHPGISHVHVTGSAATHDAIVWGPEPRTSDDTGRRSKPGKPDTPARPRLDKPVTSELGGVSPIIIVPGRWSARDLRFQAEHVASLKVHNAGHNCVAAQIVIMPADWDQRDDFVAELHAAFERIPPRDNWYPGSSASEDRARTAYPDGTTAGATFLAEVTPETSQDLLTTEYFGRVLGLTSLPGKPADYLRSAVAFANTRLAGTLGATIIVAPQQRRRLGSSFDEAVEDLRYGAIGINIWSGIAFLDPRLSWGAFPGGTLKDVGSGIGRVHNSGFVPDVERVVATGPFRPFPRSLVGGELSLLPVPPWFATARTARQTARAFTRYATRPTPARLAAVLAHAVRA